MRKKYIKQEVEKGQALVALLFFVVIATIYTSAAVIIIASNSLSASRSQRGVTTARFAEGFMEDTLLNLIRNPDYSGGTFNFEDGSVIVEITGDETKTILVQSAVGDSLRKLEAVVSLESGQLEVVSWKEVF